jgi:hypothetical protein
MKKILLGFLLLVLTSCSNDKVDGYSWNNLQNINQGGVEIEITRIAIYTKASLSKDDRELLNSHNGFYDKKTLCDLYFRVTNKSDKEMAVFPTQGLLRVGDEQVDLFTYSLFGTGDLSGDILPGVTKSGHVKFGLKNATPDEINSMYLLISAPFYNYLNQGNDYEFHLDLSEHEWVDKPKELE